MKDIITTTPMNELSRIRRSMDHLLSNWMGDDAPWEGMSEWIPTLDVSQTNGEISVRVELPGLDAKDIELTVSEDRFTLKGEKKDERRGTKSDAIRHESYFGAFQRTVQLPSAVSAEEAKARFKNGVLTVTLPTTEQTERKKISVENH